MATLHIKLDPNSVAASVVRAAIITSDVVAAALTALQEGELTKPDMPNQFIRHQIHGPQMTSDQRRETYQNWLLAKGFQDLARGVRESLEEAALYLALITKPPKQVSTSSSLGDVLETMRKPATRLSFPILLDRVNARLTSPLEFVQEFLSIQTVRNSLEHRNGIVGKQDLDDGGSTLTLTFPRWKFFYMRGEEEIEIAPGEPVDAQNEQPLVNILGRLTTRSKSYALGERITFTPEEFSEIAMACGRFGFELAHKLPTLSAPK